MYISNAISYGGASALLVNASTRLDVPGYWFAQRRLSQALILILLLLFVDPLSHKIPTGGYQQTSKDSYT